jgi:hypothetical protein
MRYIVIGWSMGGFQYGARVEAENEELAILKLGQLYPNPWFERVDVCEADGWDLPLPENFKEAVIV